MYLSAACPSLPLLLSLSENNVKETFKRMKPHSADKWGGSAGVSSAQVPTFTWGIQRELKAYTEKHRTKRVVLVVARVGAS